MRHALFLAIVLVTSCGKTKLDEPATVTTTNAPVSNGSQISTTTCNLVAGCKVSCQRSYDSCVRFTYDDKVCANQMATCLGKQVDPRSYP